MKILKFVFSSTISVLSNPFLIIEIHVDFIFNYLSRTSNQWRAEPFYQVGQHIVF